MPEIIQEPIQEPIQEQIQEPIQESIAQPNMSSDDMKADLKGDYEKVKNKEHSLNSQKLISENEAEDLKGTIVKEMFKLMEGIGVDPSNLESIRDFLTKMEQTNPDIAEMFKIAFSGITKDEQFIKPEGEIEPVADTEGLMNKFNNLGPAMMRGNEGASAPPPVLGGREMPPARPSGEDQPPLPQMPQL